MIHFKDRGENRRKCKSMYPVDEERNPVLTTDLRKVTCIECRFQTQGRRRHALVLDRFPEVEYLAGAGYCGPDWQAAAELAAELQETGA